MRKRRIEGFEEHRRRKRKARRPDGTVERAHRIGQEAMRDWQTDAVRSQSGRREADVVPIG